MEGQKARGCEHNAADHSYNTACTLQIDVCPLSSILRSRPLALIRSRDLSPPKSMVKARHIPPSAGLIIFMGPGWGSKLQGIAGSQYHEDAVPSERALSMRGSFQRTAVFSVNRCEPQRRQTLFSRLGACLKFAHPPLAYVIRGMC